MWTEKLFAYKSSIFLRRHKICRQIFGLQLQFLINQRKKIFSLNNGRNYFRQSMAEHILFCRGTKSRCGEEEKRRLRGDLLGRNPDDPWCIPKEKAPTFQLPLYGVCIGSGNLNRLCSAELCKPRPRISRYAFTRRSIREHFRGRTFGQSRSKLEATFSFTLVLIVTVNWPLQSS